MSDSELIRFGDVREGDILYGSMGQPVEVLRAYDEHIPESMYRLELDDGRTIDASGNHLWYVETQIMRSLHPARVRLGKKLLKRLPANKRDQLLELTTYDQEIETRLIDMIALLEGEGQVEKEQFLARIAASIGPLAEEVVIYEDMATGEQEHNLPVRTYDARLFAQQLLAFHHRRYRKQWPLIVGEVLTTEQLAMFVGTSVDIPVLESHSCR